MNTTPEAGQYGPFWRSWEERAHSPEYHVWDHMRRRCFKESTRSYRWYGGRGITVCDRWRDSFDAFVADMGRRPSPKHQLDRINNDGNYEPGNCRWATVAQQVANRSDNLMVTFRGETLALTAWVARLGLSYSRTHRRLEVGWPVEEAFTVPKTDKPPRGSERWKQWQANMSKRPQLFKKPAAPNTHCGNGHEFTEENSGMSGGKRYCRECKRATGARRYAASRARLAGPLDPREESST